MKSRNMIGYMGIASCKIYTVTLKKRKKERKKERERERKEERKNVMEKKRNKEHYFERMKSQVGFGGKNAKFKEKTC